jgi:alkylated DNA repair dioxygenase AlkB
MPASQPDLFEPAPAWPEGLAYAPDLIDAADEAELLAVFAGLPFKPFEFHGYLGLRQVVSFGWRYDYGQRRAGAAEPMPDFLMGLRDKVARFAGLDSGAFDQAMVTDYQPGAGIGWHRDKAVFGEVAGVSLAAPCTLRFRRREVDGWRRRSLTPAPRSAYLLKGPARTEWEHSIPGVPARRYSVTFRRYLG